MESNPALEAAIDQNPEDTSTYSVLADWLQSRGDPRGEAIATQLAGDEVAFGGLLLKHAETLLGPLTAHQQTYDRARDAAFTWKNGFIHAAKISHDSYAHEAELDLAEVLRTLLAHPSARFLRELTFGFNGDPNEDTLQALIDVLAEAPRPSLRALFFGDFKYAGAPREQDSGEDTEISWYSVGDLSALWPQVPHLEKLIVQTGSPTSAAGGGCVLGTLALPALRHFEFRTGGLDGNNSNAIAKLVAPRLEHLDVWFGQDNYGGEAGAEVAHQILARDFPNLRHLGIMNCEFVGALVPALAAVTAERKLAELDLSLGCLDDEGAAAIAAHRVGFASLASLDVSYNLLGETGLAALQGVAKRVVNVKQRDADDRFSAVGE